jgi:hypothetical protein
MKRACWPFSDSADCGRKKCHFRANVRTTRDCLALGWTRQTPERRALTDGYYGGIGGAGLVLVDLLLRYTPK